MRNYPVSKVAQQKAKTTIGALSGSAGFSKTDGVTVDTQSAEFIKRQNEGLKRLQQIKQDR